MLNIYVIGCGGIGGYRCVTFVHNTKECGVGSFAA